MCVSRESLEAKPTGPPVRVEGQRQGETQRNLPHALLQILRPLHLQSGMNLFYRFSKHLHLGGTFEPTDYCLASSC